jgi:predicted nucleotide-binding protein (sugar kinase/HSP70/actin superfamily)
MTFGDEVRAVAKESEKYNKWYQVWSDQYLQDIKDKIMSEAKKGYKNASTCVILAFDDRKPYVKIESSWN